MPEQHSRTPLSVRAPILAPEGPSDGAMALGQMADLSDLPEMSDRPHPDFLARAAIWRDQAAGLISVAEARRRSDLIGQPAEEALAGFRTRLPRLRKPAAPRPRHSRPEPQESRQYAQAMATRAARDDRLSPNAKAFLQVLRARCGKGRETTITKGTAGNIMSRSPRTIRRYLVDLVRFGYIELKTRANARGLHLGLLVTLTNLVAPFYEDMRGLARWLAESPKAALAPFTGMIDPARAGVTILTPRNQFQMNPSLRALETPPLAHGKDVERLLRRKEGRAERPV